MLKKLIKKFLEITGLHKIIKNLQNTIDKKCYQIRMPDNSVSDIHSLSEQDRLEYSIVMFLHVLEKSVVIGNKQYLQKPVLLDKLTDFWAQLQKQQVKPDSYAMQVYLSALKLCTTYQDSDTFHPLLAQIPKELLVDASPIHILSVSDLTQPKKEDYVAFANTRHSQRILSNEIIPEHELIDVVNIALLCPSACNRQPCRVYYTVDSKKREQLQYLCIDSLVSKNISNYLVVTVRKNFFTTSEMYQSWINGGIFLDSLVNAFHATGIGTCMFETSKYSKKYQQIVQLLSIPNGEDIICLVGYGRYTDLSRCIGKHRRSAEDIMIRLIDTPYHTENITK